MNNYVPSREINRKLLLTIHQDGLLDVLAGLIIATFGMVPLLDETGMNPGVRQVIFLACYAVEVVAIFWLKKAITLPRTGMVTLSRRITSKLSLTLLGVNVLIFMVFLGSYLFKWPLGIQSGSLQLSVPLGLVWMILLTSMGLLLKAIRYSIYGLLVLGISVGAEHLFNRGMLENHGIPLASFLSGGLMVLSGGIYLLRFLRKYRVDR